MPLTGIEERCQNLWFRLCYNFSGLVVGKGLCIFATYRFCSIRIRFIRLYHPVRSVGFACSRYSLMLFSILRLALAPGRLYADIPDKRDYVEINSGKFAEVKNYFKYSNMEVVRMTATPFTPFYHRVNLVISTNGSSFTVRSLKEQEAKEIYELLLYNCYIK